MVRKREEKGNIITGECRGHWNKEEKGRKRQYYHMGLHYQDESSSMRRMIQTWGHIGYNQKESISQITSHGEWEEGQGNQKEAGGGIGIRGMTSGGVSRKYSNERWWLVGDIGVIRKCGDCWNMEEKGKKKKGNIIAGIRGAGSGGASMR